MSKRKFVVHVTRAEYLDPGQCDSMVGYSITSRTRLNASMDLSDCNRKISWYFSSSYGADPLKKIDKILEIMTSFRQELVDAKKKFRASRRLPAVK